MSDVSESQYKSIRARVYRWAFRLLQNEHDALDATQNVLLKALRVPPADMTVVRFPDPAHPGRACGPLMAAARDVQLDDERENYLAEMLANLKAPGLVLYQPDGWTPPQRDAARAVLADTVGRGQRGSPLFLEGESARVDMIAPLKDLDWPGLTSLNETRICATFGVPPIVIGLRSGLEHGTYANFEQAERMIEEVACGA